MNKPLTLTSPALGALVASKPADMSALAQNAAGRGGADPNSPRGIQYARFNGNTGAFTFGQAHTPIPPDQVFIVPLHSLKHGWLYWEGGKSEKDTEVEVSAFEPFPEKPDNRPLTGTMPRPRDRDGWTQTVSFDLTGYEGLLDGFTLRLQHSSVAIQRCWGDIAMAAVSKDQAAGGQTAFVHPLILLEVGSYPHRDYGRDVFTLSPKVVGWTDGFTIEDAAAGQIAATPGDSDEDDDILG